MYRLRMFDKRSYLLPCSARWLYVEVVHKELLEINYTN